MISVASLNVRGVPLTGTRLTARCLAIGSYFESSDADVVCFQEILTYYHLALLTRRMRSFRYVSMRRTLPGPAGGVATFSRLPVLSSGFRRFGPVPMTPDISQRDRAQARIKGSLVTGLAGVLVINTHPLANRDGDWSEANRFHPLHRAQLATLARAVGGVQGPSVVCGDFNIDRDSTLFSEFIEDTGLADTFQGTCPPTFRAEYLPAGETPRCIDFILTTNEITTESAEVILSGKQPLRGHPAYLSDHAGLRADLRFPDLLRG
jgi:endonuclease/exonuclease/phosphatase family metal-dependent hydrolase